MSDDLAKRIGELGFQRVDVGPGAVGFGRVTETTPDIQGLCSPIPEHRAFLAGSVWCEGPLIILPPSGDGLVYWEQFFLLSTDEFPTPILELRDYIDYGLEADLPTATRPIGIGPGWRYLYPCHRFGPSIADLHLDTARPIVGNGIRLKRSDIDELLLAAKDARTAVSALLPVPHIWAFPDGLVVGDMDNFYDGEARTWYPAMIEDVEGKLSLSEAAASDDGVFRGYLYNKSAKPEAVEIPVRDLTVRISDASGDTAAVRFQDLFSLTRTSDDSVGL